MSKQAIIDRVNALRGLMRERGIDAYLVMTDDFHASEYVGDFFKCREFLSGFTGSAGQVVVTRDEAGLWTDGRYFLQAADQLEGTNITLRKMGQKDVPTIREYLSRTLPEGGCLGYDGRTVTVGYAEHLEEELDKKQIRYERNVDLVGELWTDRPALPCAPVWLLDPVYTGKTRAEKLADLREAMKKEGADRILIATLDDIAYLYNLRGGDVMHNPVALSYTVVSDSGAVLYISPESVSDAVRTELSADGVELRPYDQVYEDLKTLPEGSSLWLDKSGINVALLRAIPEGVSRVEKASPTTLAKAIKTKTEMDNMRAAHVQDGVAVTKLLYWLKKARADGTLFDETELSVANRLAKLRAERPGYVSLSFDSIIATGAHGAIIHYEPTPETDAKIEDDTFLLMDTGGQYMQGTTDITRTVAVGTVTDEMKKHFTAVLRGNLDLGDALFKHGCTGVNLDVLARRPLWELGLDYNHGTGHGVGYLLNVHEGPNNIGLKGRDGSIGAVLEEGMVTSNEPGFYLEGKYGIRCENLVLCVERCENDYGRFMGFDTLTMVPFDRDAIDANMLTEREKTLLNTYHAQVYAALEPYMTPEELSWLKEATAPIG